MNCCICHGRTKIIDVRTHNSGCKRRRRECIECGERFTTYELSQMQLLNKLDEHLPMDLVDKIAHVLEIELPEHEKEPKELFDFYFMN